MNKKTFDCVKLMRIIREQHRLQYQKDPSLREKRLKEIWKKYGFPEQEKIKTR